MVDKNSDILWATGRRKTSTAQVRLIPKGDGSVVVNNKPIDKFFHGRPRHIKDALTPLDKVEGARGYNVRAKISGGGVTGQAGALRHGIARALAKLGETAKKTMRKEGFLTRDARMVERKKYGQKGARKRFQFSKR